MARRVRPLSVDLAQELPAECVGCAFWETEGRLPRHCGASCDLDLLKGWIRQVIEQWGDCGRVITVDDEVVAFLKYAPATMVPQARHFPSGPPSEDAVLLTCLHIVDDARHLGLGRVLLHACFRDLLKRGHKVVESFAFDGHVAELPVLSLEFLLKEGFQVVRPHPEFPLLRLNLRSLATVMENVEAALQSIQMPLRVPSRAPVPRIEPGKR
ncbi:MAG: GNAT family N-acetyltransferase [Coriobacteriia bacterium]